MSRCKHWVFTSYDDEVKFVKDDRVVYLIYGNEVCPKTGRKHKQGYVYFKSQLRLTVLKKLDPMAHWEPKRGTVSDAINYCKKDGDFHEFGVPPVEERSNANVYADCIKAAESGNIDYIKTEHPGTFLRYKRTFEGLLKFPLADLTEPRGYWMHGTPGLGKDTSLLKLNPFEKSHNRWWDGYKGEKYVVLSDFNHKDAEYLSNYILQWADMHPFNAEVKGGVIRISPERFYVTSNFTLEEIFGHHMQWEAYKRRFHILNCDTRQITYRPRIVAQDLTEFADF